MKKTIIIITGLLLFTFTGVLLFQLNEKSFSERPFQEEKPNDWFFRQRAYPYEQINHTAYLNALEQARQLRDEAGSNRSDGIWEFAGPVNTGGRITDVEMHPSDLNTIYLGAASGGVFKSTDAGITWQPVFDDALSLSVGDIAIAPSDPDILYVGTGEANAGGGSLAYDGVGVYRSEDGGQTWQHKGLEESRNIGRMVVDPRDPDVVYVAAMGNLFADSPDRGIYKTTNGGDTWENVLFVSDSTGAIDVAINPENPDTLYAAMWERVRRPNRRSYGGPTCGIYRTFDGGTTWQELTNGLPTLAEDKGRIGIDISASDPNILYAIYADSIGYMKGVYKTFDGGDTWIQTNDGGLSGAYYSYGWWFGRIKIDPVDPDIAFVIGFTLYRTKDGGNSWTDVSGWDVHVDQHGLYIHPLNHNFMVLGNDGGLYLSYDGGNSWNWNKTIPITQFYTCEVDHQMPWRLYGGTQDNGTNRTPTGALDDWEMIYGGDGFYVLVDPLDNNYIYAEYQYGGLGRSTNGGWSFSDATSGISQSDRFNWNCPLAFDPSDPKTLYFGTNRLYKTVNRAVSWFPVSGDLTDGDQPGNLAYNTLTTISVSPVNTDIIYTGSDDGNVYVTQDGGQTWQNISAGLPKRWITRVAADPVEETTAYVTISGYRWDEFMPHVFRTEDLGQTWEDISANLPEAPVNDIIVDPGNSQVLFVATDVGVYVTWNGGTDWEMLGDNLPNVVVNDLDYHQPTNKLIAATYGRSLYTYDLEQDTLTSTAEISDEAGIVIFPNPFSNEITIDFQKIIPVDNILITDLSGKVVRHIGQKGIPKSTGRIIWNGMDETGEKLPAGIYVCVIQTGNKTISRKIVKK